MSPKPVSTIPDMDKTRELLLAELNDLRARNAALEQYKARTEQLEADLRKNEEMTRQLLEQKLYGVWVNVGNKVAYINEVGASILGASNPGEVVGKSLFELVHPDYQGIVRDRIEAMSHGDRAVPMIEEKYFRVDGQAVDVDVWAMRFIYKGEPAILVAFKDITERKRADMALRESEAKYRDLVKNANSIIIRWDLKGNLTFFNEFAEEFFGYPASEVLGKNVMDTIVPAAESTGKDLAAMISDIELHPERYKTNINENIRRNGERVWISWTNKAILNTQGKVVEILSVGNDITERKRAEEALKKSEQFLNNILDCIHDGISVLDKDLNIIRVNPVMEEWYAHAMPIQGKKCYSAYHGQTRPCEVCPSKRAIEQGSVQHDVVPFHHENGTIKGWLEIYAYPLKDDNGNIVGVIEHVRDISERKQAEEALSKNLAMLAKSQEIGRLASWSFDCASEKFEITDEMYRLYGFAPGVVEPTKDLLYKVIHPDDLEKYREYFESLLEGRLGGFDYRVVWPDGSVHYLHVITDSNVRGPNGRVKMMSGITQDITERKQAEEALKAAKAQAELYLDLMGHDINNMHQIALGYLEMAHDMPPGPMKDEMIEKPIEVLQRSTQLIKNVRKLQKLSDGLFQDTVIDVVELLSDVQRELGSLPGKVVSLNLNGCDHCRVRANELLHDVFSNLVGNAIKHTGDRADILVDLNVVNYKGGRYCQVSVEDNGRGIPDDFKARIFHRGLKGTNKAKGMGLGLYLVKSLVESYSGRVWVEDRVPGDYTKGARFVVMLPAVEKR
jgi:PAS domain S-box-containing protein